MGHDFNRICDGHVRWIPHVATWFTCFEIWTCHEILLGEEGTSPFLDDIIPKTIGQYSPRTNHRPTLQPSFVRYVSAISELFPFSTPYCGCLENLAPKRGPKPHPKSHQNHEMLTTDHQVIRIFSIYPGDKW